MGPVRPALSSQDELLLASGHARRERTLKVRIRGLALALLCTLHPLVTDDDRAPLSSARHKAADAWGRGRHTLVHRVSGSKPRGLRTHRRSGRSRPLRSAVVENQAPSVAV